MNSSDFIPVKATEEQIIQITAVTKDYKELADAILAAIAPSAHRTAALRMLLESKMTLTHAITHPQAVDVAKEFFS